MEILIILALILAGIVLMLVELFLFPGFFVFGLASGGCLAFANYYAFARLGMTEGFLTLAGTGIACILSVVWFMRSKALDKVSLKANITSRIERPAEGQVKIGDTGIATTRLALIGYANVEGKLIEVKSEDGLVDEKTPVIVTRITDDTIFVSKL